MALWQMDAAKKMEELLSGFLVIESLSYSGSLLEPNTLDAFSDVDMVIRLSTNAALDQKRLLCIISDQLCGVFGHELFLGDTKDTLRICLENGWRFDLTFAYPMPKKTEFRDVSAEDRIDSVIHPFWFAAAMVLAKHGRKDHLVAAHLALEMCQLTIVVQMLVRDKTKRTDRHRFGDGEDVPILRSLARMEGGILDLLYQAAEQMDTLCELFALGYPKRTGQLRAMNISDYSLTVAPFRI